MSASMDNAPAVALGVAFSVLAPWLQLYWTQVTLWRRLVTDAGGKVAAADKAHRRDLPAVVGLIERVLYYVAMQVHAPEFVGIWLALKVAGSWDAWVKGRRVPSDEDLKNGEKQVTVVGRHEFNTFLIGSGQSVLFAVCGSKITDWLRTGDRSSAGQLAGATVLGSCGLLLWAFLRSRRKATP